MNDDWVSDSDIEAANMERMVYAGESNIEAAQRRLEELSTSAVNTLSNLMLTSPSDKVRMDAARYVLDRALGPVRDSNLVQNDIANRKLALARQMADQMGFAISQMLDQLGVDTNDPAVRQIAYQALEQAGAARD